MNTSYPPVGNFERLFRDLQGRITSGELTLEDVRFILKTLGWWETMQQLAAALEREANP
jgi:hypothetical protein